MPITTLFTHTKKSLFLLGSALLLCGCNGFFEKDNTPKPAPLLSYTPETKPVRIWSTKAGSGIDNDDYLKMGLTLSDQTIFTASEKGLITSIDKLNGRENWQIYTGFSITTAPGAGDDLVIVGGRRGEVLALRKSTGQTVWKTNIASQPLAKPVIKQNIVLIKSVDGYLRALSSKDGHELWAFQQAEPSLILRSASTPLISGSQVVAGFANGNLAKLNLRNGQVIWVEPMAIPQGAFAIQRMIDIDADPVLFDHHLYAATYQGKINSLDLANGKFVWSHDISSYTGMIADSEAVYITDAKSYIWAFDANSGLVNWRQLKLESRVITAPAMQKNYVVIGDGEGYLHWLDKRDGHIAAREYLGAMFAAPTVDENGILYAITNKGYLAAYKLN